MEILLKDQLIREFRKDTEEVFRVRSAHVLKLYSFINCKEGYVKMEGEA